MYHAIYNNTLINIEKFDSVFLKKISENKQIFCPDCKKPVIFKEYTGKQNHFSHYNLDCSYPFSEPESIEHETGKKVIYEWLISQFGQDDCFIEKKINETNQRSDTFVSSIRTACEFQCSPIQSKTWKTRNDLYKKANVNDLWILGYSMHKYSSTSPYFHKLNSLEEEMIEHHGKVIYFDVLTRQFVFLIPEKKSKNSYIGKEYFFKPNEVLLKERKITSKYDFFLDMQIKRRTFSYEESDKASSTSKLIKEIKTLTIDKTKVLATQKQISYIKFLLHQTNNKIPYKFHGLLKSEADSLIKELETKRKTSL